MIEKHIGKIIFIILCSVIFLIVTNSKIFEKKDTTLIKPQKLENEVNSSNKMKDVDFLIFSMPQHCDFMSAAFFLLEVPLSFFLVLWWDLK